MWRSLKFSLLQCMPSSLTASPNFMKICLLQCPVESLCFFNMFLVHLFTVDGTCLPYKDWFCHFGNLRRKSGEKARIKSLSFRQCDCFMYMTIFIVKNDHLKSKKSRESLISTGLNKVQELHPVVRLGSQMIDQAAPP